MTKNDFINVATPLIRQGITLVSGLVAAKGFSAAGNSLTEWAVTGSLLAASIGWALVEKSKLLSAAVSAAPTDDLSALIAAVGQFRAQGASPLLVAHLAQTAAALAVAETQTTAAPLAATPTVQAPPADAVVPPPPASPGVTAAAAGVQQWGDKTFITDVAQRKAIAQLIASSAVQAPPGDVAVTPAAASPGITTGTPAAIANTMTTPSLSAGGAFGGQT